MAKNPNHQWVSTPNWNDAQHYKAQNFFKSPCNHLPKRFHAQIFRFVNAAMDKSSGADSEVNLQPVSEKNSEPT